MESADQNGSAIMTELAEVPMQLGVWRTLARRNLELHQVRSPILRYGLAVVCLAIALGLSLTLKYLQFRDVEAPLFTLAIDHRYLVRRNWAFRAGGPAIHGVL
jgi:hypothetical protein